MSSETTTLSEEAQVSTLETPTMPETKKYYNEVGEEVMFPGGPTIAMKNYWKQMYTNIFATDFMDEVIIWRGMNRAEYKKLFTENQNTEELLFEEILAEKVILWPGLTRADFAVKKAGIPGTVSKQLLEVSGFNAPPPIPL